MQSTVELTVPGATHSSFTKQFSESKHGHPSDRTEVTQDDFELLIQLLEISLTC